MTRKNVLYALAVAVWIGSMAAVALADQSGTHQYGSPDSSVSSQPGQQQQEPGVVQPQPGEIREPMETGAVPEQPGDSSYRRSYTIGNVPTLESGAAEFRKGIDTGP